MNTQLAIAKPKTTSERRTRTTVDTIMVTPELVEKWKAPPFQRPLRENDKVRALAEKLKIDGGVWPGVITLGVLEGTVYLLDGQHRRTAFLISKLSEGFTDIRTHYFESLAEMGEEFVLLNSQLVTLRPDDILRGLQNAIPALQEIRRRCPYVGYDQIRRGSHSPLLSMATVIRCWFGSATEVPSAHGAAGSAQNMAHVIDEQSVKDLCDFLGGAIEAFGRDAEYFRLWGTLNLTLCMWMYRRLVLSQYSSKSPKLTRAMFTKCLMSVSSATSYLDWLVGRQLTDRDRGPAYVRIKSAFVDRIRTETGEKPMLPQPAWCAGHMK